MEYFEVDGTKIDVVYNGVDDVFRRHLRPDELERALKSLEIPRPYLLFVGNPAKKHKNLDNVVKAYARARQIHPFDAPLVCVGDRTSAGFKFLQRAAQLGIGDRVLLLGHVAPEALPAIYQGASLFLYPTLYEGFGLPVAEAMASGVPVITSNTSSLKEIAEGYSHLVDPLNVEGMAKAIAQCMADEDHRKALAKLGLRRARTSAGRAPPSAPWRSTGAPSRDRPWPRQRRRLRRLRRRLERPARSPSAAPRWAKRAARAAGDRAVRARPALVHDWLTGMRGGEKVLEAISSLLPGAPIHTLFHFPGSVSRALRATRCTPAFCSGRRAPAATTGVIYRSSPPPSRASTSPATTW